jgi:CBS domain-containing protein
MTTTPPEETTLEALLGTVGAAMTDRVVLVDADQPADVAARRLERDGVSGAPVVRRGRVVGVVTLRDLLTPLALAPLAPTTGPFLRHEHQLAGIRVHQLMSTEPATARTDWPLGRAVLCMQEAGVNRLPVVDPTGRPVGILTPRRRATGDRAPPAPPPDRTGGPRLAHGGRLTPEGRGRAVPAGRGRGTQGATLRR